MDQAVEAGFPFPHEQLPRLHTITREIERTCRTQLRGYLDAMAPLFRPRRVLGNHMEGPGKENVTGADQNFAEVREMYIKACGRPFHLKKELISPLESFPSQMQLHPWEYTYEIRTDQQRRSITVVTPLTWVLSYSSTYSFPMLRQVVQGRGDQDAESLRSYVLRASVLALLFAKLPELSNLFDGLRFKVEPRRSAQLGELPLITVSAPITTVRPTDDLLLRATELSGRTEFVEVVDPDRAAHLRDPLQAQFLKALDAESELRSIDRD